MVKALERQFKRAVAGAVAAVARHRRAPAALPRQFRSILVVRQHNQLGDMLCAVPLLRALSARYPGVPISLLASPVNCDVMLHNRYLAEVILYDKRSFRGVGGVVRLVRFLRGLRRHRFDVSIVPSTVSMSTTSELLGILSGAPVRVGAASVDGVRNRAAGLLTHPVVLDWRGDPHRHQALRNLDVAGELDVKAKSLELEITLKPEEVKQAKSLFFNRQVPGTSCIVLHPGAGKIPNRWPAERFAQVGNALAKAGGARIIVTLGPMDEEPGRIVLEHLTCTHELVRNEPLRRVAAILSFADLVVTNDTGIMHVAAGVGVPVLSLFGPTDPGQWAPPGEIHRFIQGKGGDVSAIGVDEVVEAARGMLRMDRGRRHD